VKAYLDWIHSDEGQRIAKESGYFPVAAKWRTAP
jgi:ABC-type Fe3+ transport system substrate-binding protein